MRDSRSAGPRKWSRSPWLALGLLLALGGLVWQTRASELDLRYAAYGFSPMTFAVKRCHPEWFARDFPSGVENLARSAPMHVYPLAYRLLGIAPERLLPVVLAAEMVVLAAGVIVLTRTLRPRAPAMAGVLVAVLVLASHARNMNFGAYRQPFLWAKYHNFADGLRLLAVAAVVGGRPVAAGLLAAGSLMSHPTMGLMGAVVVAACAAAKPRELLGRRAMAGVAAFLVPAGLWAVLAVGTGTGGERVPHELWFDLTRLASFHWYPIHNGLLTFAHEAALLPFLSLTALGGFYLVRAGPVGERDRRVLWGAAAALGLVLVGLVFSVVEVSPLVTKLALHRANGVVVTLALIYAVAGLWADVEAGAPWRRLVAAGVLVLPFLAHPDPEPGFPLVLTLALTLPAWLPLCQGRLAARRDLLAVVPAALGATLVVVYAGTELLGPLTGGAYTGWRWLGRWPMLVGLGVVAAAAAAPKARRVGLVPLVVLVAFAGGAVTWTLSQRLTGGQRAFRRDLKNAQLWAREHTATDALFLVDPALHYPAMGYGWRDYARRSSWGSLREWLLTGWNYTSDLATCREGLRRLEDLGVDVEDYLGHEPPRAGFAELSRDLLRRYYTADDPWRLDLARRHGIDYSVSRPRGSVAASDLHVAYRNDHVVIHDVRPSHSPQPA
ncbi:MAG: hypothetical protein ACOC8D_01075, partial [bacterium]